MVCLEVTFYSEDVIRFTAKCGGGGVCEGKRIGNEYIHFLDFIVQRHACGKFSPFVHTGYKYTVSTFFSSSLSFFSSIEISIYNHCLLHILYTQSDIVLLFISLEHIEIQGELPGWWHVQAPNIHSSRHSSGLKPCMNAFPRTCCDISRNFSLSIRRSLAATIRKSITKRSTPTNILFHFRFETSQLNYHVVYGAYTLPGRYTLVCRRRPSGFAGFSPLNKQRYLPQQSSGVDERDFHQHFRLDAMSKASQCSNARVSGYLPGLNSAK